MPDEKPYIYENVPIPSYDEATSSRTPTPAPARRNEPGNDEERQSLMGGDAGGRFPVPTRRVGYVPPATDDNTSERDSLDEVDMLIVGDDGVALEDEEVRREMEEMEIMDPAPEPSRWTKRISSISQSLHLPFTFKLPSWKLKMPKFDLDMFIIIGRIFGALLIMGIIYLVFVSDLFTNAAQRMAGQIYEPEHVRLWLQEQVNPKNLRDYLQHITAYDHLAGTEGDYVLSQWVKEKFNEAGLENVHSEEYGVYLNYPKAGGRAVELLNADGTVKWNAKIEEESAYPNENRQQTPSFHGHSRAGDVKGPLIYANYGSREDFQWLRENGIETKGAIALVRYYGTQGDRALKVKAAELAGFVGCIIYSDPKDDGYSKGAVWPEGRYMPTDGVQRGAVSLMSWVVGDVLTPGWASVKGEKRISKNNNSGLTNIPSIPLAWRDAQPLLLAINGVGTKCPNEFEGSDREVQWWSGSLSSPVVRLKNEQDEVDEQPIWNIIGQIHGTEQGEKSIIVGNHRDAWAFGASDPGSGTAVLLEVARIFGSLKHHGWRPLRTIEFASWDGEEYNLIGSTEHVEENMESLRRDAFAYINIDGVVSGPDFFASASPVFKKSLLRVLDRVSDPAHNASLLEVWQSKNTKLGGLGAGSDYVAFQDMAGTSSIDFGFIGDKYPYHSVYDNFEWMDRFGDPGFSYHQTIAQVLALLILELADEPVLPFDMTAYSAAVTQYVMELDHWANANGANEKGNAAWSIEPLTDAVLQFQKDAMEFEKWEVQWQKSVYGGTGFENSMLGAHRLSHNNRMANFETHLLDLEDGGGIPGREQFKHILFGPQLWSGYDEAFFPAVRDAVEAGDWVLAQKQVIKAAAILKQASLKLVGN